jgi:hypothetical protein
VRPRVGNTTIDLLSSSTSHEIASNVTPLTDTTIGESLTPPASECIKANLLLPPFTELNRRKPGHLGSLESSHTQPVRESYSSFVAVAIGSACDDSHVRADRGPRTGSPRD